MALIGQFAESDRLLRDCEERWKSLGMVRRVMLLIFWGKIKVLSGNYDQVITSAEEARVICLRLGIRKNLANANYMLGVGNAAFGFCATSRVALLQCQPIFEKMGNLWGIGAVKHQLGLVSILEGNWEEAHRLLVQSVADLRRSGYVEPVCKVLSDLSIVERKLGRVSAARACLAEVLAIAIDYEGIVINRYLLPALAFDTVYRDPERALELHALASRFPYLANTARFALVGAMVAEAARALPPEVVAAAQQRGEQRELWSTLRECLTEVEVGFPLAKAQIMEK
jgi:hypothetical protein